MKKSGRTSTTSLPTSSRNHVAQSPVTSESLDIFTEVIFRRSTTFAAIFEIWMEARSRGSTSQPSSRHPVSMVEKLFSISCQSGVGSKSYCLQLHRREAPLSHPLSGLDDAARVSPLLDDPSTGQGRPKDDHQLAWHLHQTPRELFEQL